MISNCAPLHELAARQGGILLTAQALAITGWSQRRLLDYLHEEGWQPIHRGAWAAPGHNSGARMQLRAIQLQHPTLVASHRSAAALHRIELTTYAVEVTDSASRLSRLLDYAIRRLPLTEADIVTIGTPPIFRAPPRSTRRSTTASSTRTRQPGSRPRPRCSSTASTDN